MPRKAASAWFVAVAVPGGVDRGHNCRRSIRRYPKNVIVFSANELWKRFELVPRLLFLLLGQQFLRLQTNVLAEIDNSAIQISEQANFNFLATSPYEISVKKRI